MPYWGNWNGLFPPGALIPLGFNLLLVAVGIGVAWKRQRGLGLLPIWIGFCYALGNALVRSSGWRFNLPVDWIGLFYYALGLLQLIIWSAMFFANRFLPSPAGFADESHPQAARFPWRQALAIGVIFFLVSTAIPITEAAIPPRYPAGWLEDQLANPGLQEQLRSSGIDPSRLGFAQENGLRMLSGRALYPRHYPPKKGIPGEAWPAFVPRDDARLGFYLVGPSSQNVVLAHELAPASFPHAADVIVLGCQRDEYLEAQMVVLVGETSTILLRDPQPDWACNLAP